MTTEQEVMEKLKVPTSKREALGEVLKKIMHENGGMVTAYQLVEFARPTESPLHPYFTWDDTEAARLHRLNEARFILRVAVEYVGAPDRREAIRVAVHLSSDDAGYRLLAEVLTDEEMRMQLISDAARDVDVMKNKYTKLVELRPAISKLAKTVEKLRKPAAKRK